MNSIDLKAKNGKAYQSINPRNRTAHSGMGKINLKEIKMDTGYGKFEMMEDLKEQDSKKEGIFSVGEILEIKGSIFKILEIKNWKESGRMLLKLMPKANQNP